MKILFLLLLVVLGIIYLNRSYAYFYDYHGTYFLSSPKTGTEYLIGKAQSGREVFQFVALGDSLTAGVGAEKIEESYPHLLAKFFATKDLQVKLINSAIPGANTADVRVTELKEVPDTPDLVLVLTGTNDVHNLVPPAQFESDLRRILQVLKEEKKARKILLLTIPYLGSDDTLLFPYNILLTLRIGQFNGIIERLSGEYNTNLIDLYGLTTEIRKDPKYYAKDKFHPSSYGYQKWSEVIINASRDSIP